MQKLRDPGVIVAVTLSRQSVASIGVASKLTPQEVTTKLAAGLRSLGAKLVLNAGAGQDLALMEAAAEFMERYRAQHSMPTGTLKGLTEVLLSPYFVKSKAYLQWHHASRVNFLPVFMCLRSNDHLVQLV